MNSNIFARITVAMLITSSFLCAQFGDVDVTFDDRLLRDGDRQQLAPLQDEIKRFFQNTEWDEEYNDLEIPLHIQIIFDGTSTKGSEMVYLAQALFSNGLDQRYFDKSFNFRQSESGSLYYDTVIFDPLASFLAYYANLIIAGEADTYKPKGGNRFYEIARSIALRGTQSDYPRGWSERLRIENLLSSNHGFRKVRLATYLGLEHFEYGEFDDAIKQFNIMIKGLDEVHLQSPREHYTRLFMNGHAEDLAKRIGYLKQDEILHSLIELDPDNSDIYEAELTDRSK
jgi:tetratricopeptide (TPR) repeat protein